MTVVDAAERHAIASALDETLFVEAGAGSGKTSSLVARLVALVASGVPVDGIAAITFTEAAAAELRARVRGALETAVAGGDVRGVDLDDTARKHCREALAALDRATISTLHSFAQQILAAHPVEVGLPPRVAVHDELSSALGFEDRWSRAVVDLLDDDDLAEPLELLNAFSVGFDELRHVARDLANNWDLLVDLDLDPKPRPLTVDLTPLREPMARLADLLAECSDDEDPLAVATRGRLEWLATVERHADDAFTQLLVLGSPSAVRGNSGRKPAWGAAKAEVHDLHKQCHQIATDIKNAAIDTAIRPVLARLVDVTLRSADARRAEGRLEFHDLLVLARQLLRTAPHARQRLHDRYQRLLIDEFQDTDPIQVELAVRIAADPGIDGSTPWEQLAVDGGRVFFVGDPKQSIYRFRRADIALFERAGHTFSTEPTRLRANFRTTAPILEAVNVLFDQLIADGSVVDTSAGPVMAQPRYVPLDPVRPPITGDPGPSVAIVSGPIDARAAEIRTAEAADVAGALAAAHRDGWLVQPHGVEEARPARWSDMCVLLPSRTSLPFLIDALDDAAIPYRIESGSLLYSTTEVRDLMAVLTAIDDPGNEIAVLGALRSPAYGCGDDDLYRWVEAGGRLQPLRTPPDAVADDDPVRLAMADLAARHRRRAWQRPAEVIDEVCRDRMLFELALDADRPRDLWRRYRVVIDHARQWADDEAGDLRGFVRWAEMQRSDTVRATETVLPEADLDAVRIMTIHGSKGLEFGICAVSGMSTKGSSPSTRPTVLYPEGDVAVRLRSKVTNVAFDSAKPAEDQMDVHERIRLLYVALTRARDHLIVSAAHKPAKSDSDETRPPGRRIHLLREQLEAIDGVVSFMPEPVSAAGAAGRGLFAPSAEPVDPAAGLDARRKTIEASRLSGAVAATAVARWVAARDKAEAPTDGDAEPAPIDLMELAEAIDGEATPPWRRGRAGTSIGRATHAVLEHVDFDDPADLDALVAWHCRAEGVSDSEAVVAAKVRAALASDVIEAARTAKRVWREINVAVPTGPDGTGHVLEGFVDLLYETDEGLVVVDYKTDSARTEAELDAAVDRYRLQGAAYAEALSRAQEIPVIDAVFLFLVGDRAVARSVPDLDAARRQVGEAIAAMALGVPGDRASSADEPAETAEV